MFSYSSSDKLLPPTNKAVGMCRSEGGRLVLEPRPEEGTMEVSPEKSAGSSWRAVEREREVWTTWGVLESVVGGGEDEKLKKEEKISE